MPVTLLGILVFQVLGCLENTMAVSSPRPSVEEIVSDFAKWLSGRRWPQSRCQHYASLVEDFLRWQRDQRGLHVWDCSEDSYCVGLLQSGGSPVQVAEVRMVMDLFRDYLKGPE